MKKYVNFCKKSCAPRLSADSASTLASYYVSVRSDVQKREKNSGERSSIPITVRQLEAIIRIAESLAKMTLTASVSKDHIQEAISLFGASTIQAALSGYQGYNFIIFS